MEWGNPRWKNMPGLTGFRSRSPLRLMTIDWSNLEKLTYLLLVPLFTRSVSMLIHSDAAYGYLRSQSIPCQHFAEDDKSIVERLTPRKGEREKAFLACIYRRWFPRLSSKLLLIPGCERWHRVSSAYCMTSRERGRGERERVFFLTCTARETTLVICISRTPRVWWHPTQKRSVSFTY